MDGETVSVVCKCVLHNTGLGVIYISRIHRCCCDECLQFFGPVPLSSCSSLQFMWRLTLYIPWLTGNLHLWEKQQWETPYPSCSGNGGQQYAWPTMLGHQCQQLGFYTNLWQKKCLHLELNFMTNLKCHHFVLICSSIFKFLILYFILDFLKTNHYLLVLGGCFEHIHVPWRQYSWQEVHQWATWQQHSVILNQEFSPGTWVPEQWWTLHIWKSAS